MLKKENTAPIENCANILQFLNQQGISAIPLQGKRPHFPIKWKHFQFALPTLNDINSWVQHDIQS